MPTSILQPAPLIIYPQDQISAGPVAGTSGQTEQDNTPEGDRR
jgi:hypothetical protein